MIKSIDYCYQNNKIASFYCNQDDLTMHLTGYIEKYNQSELLIAHISAHGYYDGFVLKHIDDVYRIDYDGNYEKKIEKLYCLKNQKHNHVDTFKEDDDEILYSLLDYAKNNNYFVTLNFENNYLSGIVNGYDDNIIYLSIVNDYGVEDGISIIDLNEALSICVDTDDEQDLKLLYRGDLTI